MTTTPVRRSRRRVERETHEYAAAVRRIIRAHGRRVADADPEDLAELLALRGEVETAIQTAVTGMRERHTWAEIAAVAGVSKQAAQQRWGRDG